MLFVPNEEYYYDKHLHLSRYLPYLAIAPVKQISRQNYKLLDKHYITSMLP